MKKYLQKLLSISLIIVIVFSMITMGITSISSAEIQLSSTGITGSGLASAVVNRVAGRLFTEFTSYCISNEVPVLGSAFYVLLCDPATRSTMKMKGQVSEIYSDVKEIKQDVKTIMNDLDTIYNELQEMDSENKYLTAKAKIEKYCIDTDGKIGYQTLWMKYESVLENYNMAEEKRDALESETDSEERGKLEQEILDYENAAQDAMDDFVEYYQIAFFGGKELEYDPSIYERDMNNISGDICSVNKDMDDFLPALENMLRTKFDYEHQITDIMLQGFEYCEAVQYQMYLIHREYASYCEAKKLEGSSSDEAPKLSEDFFKNENEIYLSNIEEQISNSGIHTLIVTSTLDEEEAATPSAPYEFNSIVKINGKDVPCYIIRDNKDLSYYVVTKEAEIASQLVSHREERWDNLTYVDYYQPYGMFDAQYTDNGEFKMISSLSEVSNLDSKPLSYFINSGMDIDQHADYILLYNYEFAGLKNDEVLWNMKFASSNNYNNNDPDANESTFSSKEVYNGSAKNNKFIRIYKSVYNDALFDNKDNTLVVKEKDSMPKLIALHDGQVLDFSKVQLSAEGCTIILTGNATVIGNPDVALTGSQIIVCTDEQVTLKDVSVSAAKYESAIEVRCADAKISFEGKNTFTGNGEAVDLDTMVMLDTNNYNPVGASHGMLINNDASVTLTGATATFNGDAGGAGICTWGNLIIDNATIIAKGSYEELNSYYGLYEMFKAPVYSVGAGIGASAVCVKNDSDSTVYLNEKLILGRTYAKYGTVTIKNNSDVTAQGAYPDGDESGSYASDIGGVRYVTHIDGEEVLGWIPTDITYTYGSRSIGGGNITDSKVNVYKGNIGGNIKQSNNTYDYTMDTYTITTCTAGSDGVTDDKLEFNLIGNKGSASETISSSKCGNNQGTYTITGDMGYIGTELLAIEVEIDGNDGWYPEYINVKSENGKINRTLYGGRWLDDRETITLTPDDNVFKVNIKTANVDGAGTDAGVYAQLVDKNGKTSEQINVSDVHPKSNAFEKNDNMSVYMYAPDGFDKLEYINVKTETNGTAAADWKLESIGAEQVSGKNKSDKFSITANQWDPNDITMSFGRETGKSGTFEFDIKTQNKTGAGTDATIKFRLIGENGQTNLVNIEPFIDCYTSGDNFEKNDHDKGRITFEMPTGGIGTITDIYVESSGGAASADWDLEYIDITEIVPGGTGQHVRFNANYTIKKNSNKTFTSPVLRSSAVVSSHINRELLEKFRIVEENSYLLSVSEPVTIKADALELIKSNNIILTVEMKDGDNILYQVTFDGSKIKTFGDVTLNKNYGVKDKETFIQFVENGHTPEGTTLTLYFDKLGFTEDDIIGLYVKDENGKVTEHSDQPVAGEVYHEFEITKGEEYFIKSKGENTASKDDSAHVDKGVVSTGSVNPAVVISVILSSMCFVGFVFVVLSKKEKEW